MTAFLNYTTKIPAAQTVAEVQALLGASGASAVATLYEGGKASGVSFVLDTDRGRRTFTLPVDVDGVLAALKMALTTPMATKAFRDQRKSANPYLTSEHAEKVAWRVVKDWLEAQLALVAARMASLDVVMLPYLQIHRDGRTLGQAYAEQGPRALTAGDA